MAAPGAPWDGASRCRLMVMVIITIIIMIWPALCMNWVAIIGTILDRLCWSDCQRKKWIVSSWALTLLLRNVTHTEVIQMLWGFFCFSSTIRTLDPCWMSVWGSLLQLFFYQHFFFVFCLIYFLRVTRSCRSHGSLALVWFRGEN